MSNPSNTISSRSNSPKHSYRIDLKTRENNEIPIHPSPSSVNNSGVFESQFFSTTSDNSINFDLEDESENETQDTEIEIGSRMSQKYIFPQGTLSNVVSLSVNRKEILSAQEESQISESKKILSNYVGEIKIFKEIYKHALKNKESQIEIKITRRSGKSETELVTLKYLKEQCVSKQNEAFEYVEFLAGKATRLFKAGNYERAEKEYKSALDYLTEIYTPNHIKTFKVKLDYANVLLFGRDPKRGQELTEKTLTELKLELSSPTCSEDIKHTVAIVEHSLAQYYLNQNDLDSAEPHFNISKKLRIEYAASESEMDSIYFSQGKIEFIKGNHNEAMKILRTCYNFRVSQDKLNHSLIPVLEMLTQICRRLNDDDEMHFLSHMLEIQKHYYGENNRIVTRTKLKILQFMKYLTSSGEYWAIMNEVETQLNNIPVTKESEDVALIYIELTNTRLTSLLPKDWSRSKSHTYYQETLKLIGKAEAHFKALQVKNDWIQQCKKVKETCLRLIESFADPSAVNFIGDRPHPEDVAAQIAIDTNMIAGKSGTEKELEILSEFSSEARQSLIDPEDRLLTVADFNLLPKSGNINPFKLRVAQGGISPTFGDGQSLEEMKKLLIEDPNYSNNIPEIEIGIYLDKIYSFDTRRVLVHMHAKEENNAVTIRYKKISGEHLEQRIKDIFSPRPWNGLVTAMRFGGKDSESQPYINPAARPQLELKVNKEFKSFPSDRKEADPNGFPIVGKKAQKIHAFLVKKANEGSKLAKETLKKAKNIFDTEGKERLHLFLIEIKNSYKIKNKNGEGNA